MPEGPRAEVLRRIISLARELIDARVAGTDVTVAQAFLLLALDGPLAMSQVAERLHCEASNVTGMVDRLEARGLVERRPRADDRRVKEIALTAAGTKARREAQHHLRAAPGVAALSDEELATLRELLERISGALPSRR